MRRHWLILGMLVASAAAFQVWFAGISFDPRALNPRELSGVYTRALAAGHAFVALNPGTEHIYHDSSLYHGKEYMCFGIVPFLVFMVPFFLATGLVPPPAAGVVLFLALGYAAYGAIVVLALSRARQRVRPGWTAAALVCVIVCNGTWFLLGQAVIYELENAAAFGLLGLCLLLVALFELRVAGGVAILAGAAGGAALLMGCRPNYLPAVAAVGLWVTWRAFGRLAPGRGLRNSVIALAPMAIIGAALGWWNYHRFDNPLDFGIVHTVPELTAPDPNRPLASLRFTRYFLYRYVAGSANVERYFPFIQGQSLSHLQRDPYQQEGDEIYGFLVVTPVLLFGLLGLWPSIRRPAGPSLGLVLLLVACFAGNLGFLCLVAIGCYRYPSDFLGPLALLAAWGISSLGGVPQLWLRRALAAVLGPVLLWSSACSLLVMASVAQINQSMDQRRPRAFAALSRPFNAVVYAWERWAHDPPRSLAVTIRLPGNATGKVQPLVVDGQIGAQDFLYLNYPAPDKLVIGFESTGLGGVHSAYLPVDYARPHRVEIRYGAFLPPDDHPGLAAWAPEDRLLARHMLTILLDGAIVLDGWATFHAPRAAYWVGSSPWDPAFGSRFTGQILAIEHPPLLLEISPERWRHDAYGPVSFEYAPAPMPPGVFEPLVSTGLVPQSGQLLLEHCPSELVRLVWLGEAGRRFDGQEFAWPSGQTRKLRFAAGSLYPPVTSGLWRTATGADRRARKSLVQATVESAPPLILQAASPESAPAAVIVGRDTLGTLAGVLPTASGTLTGAQREAW